MGRSIAVARVLVCSSLAAYCQPATPLPTFEVASVKLNKSGVRGGSLEFSKGGERFTAINMPFGALILVAYNITVRQLSDPPEFVSEKYDVVAKAEHPVHSEEMLRMLQALLADRFKLVVRRETREVPVYALTLARGGPKLQPTASPGNPATVPRTPAHASGNEVRSGHVAFQAESMPDFAWALTRMAGIGDRIVVDETGLRDRYDFELKFGRDHLGTENVPSQDPSIFSALQEQLGLKLESKKAPVEFLIIDHVERPSEN